MDEVCKQLRDLFNQVGDLTALLVEHKREVGAGCWQLGLIEYHLDTVTRNLDSAIWAGEDYLRSRPKEEARELSAANA